MFLENQLKGFKGAATEEDLQKHFLELAKGFLYGGYIQVRDDYRIYIFALQSSIFIVKNHMEYMILLYTTETDETGKVIS